MHITALAIAVPMVAAAFLVAVRHWTPRLLNDLAATGVGISVVQRWLPGTRTVPPFAAVKSHSGHIAFTTTSSCGRASG